MDGYCFEPSIDSTASATFVIGKAITGVSSGDITYPIGGQLGGATEQEPQPSPEFFSLSYTQIGNNVESVCDYRELHLKSSYSLVGDEQVISYINSNPELWDFILSAHADLTKYADFKYIELSVYEDVEENWQKLFLSINHIRRDLDEILDIEDLILDKWLLPKDQLLRGRVVLAHV